MKRYIQAMLFHPMALLSLMMVLAGPIPGSGQQAASSLELLLTTAQKAQTSKDYAGAAAAYKQAVQMQPNIAELWANLGLMEQETSNYSDAVASFQHANRLSPSLYVPNLFLGMDYVREGKPQQAVVFLVKAEKINASDMQAVLALGRAYTALGKYTLATRELMKAVSLDPKQSPAWFALGITALDKMEEDSRTLSAKQPESVYAKALLAESLDKQSRFVEASKALTSVIDLKPQPPCLLSQLGWSLLKQENFAEAASEFQKERNANPECSMAILGQAAISSFQDADEESLKLLEELWDRDHGFVQANLAMVFDGLSADHASRFAALLAQQREIVPVELYGAITAAMNRSTRGKDYEDGITQGVDTKPAVGSPFEAGGSAQSDYAGGHFRRCAERSRSSLTAKKPHELQLLAACSFLTGDYRHSAEASAALQAVSPDSSNALYWSIQANSRLAFQSLARFEELEPNSARSHLLLGDIYRQRKAFNAALNEYKKALAIAPDDPAAMLGMASSYLGNDDIDKTIETAKTALQHSPDDPELNLLMAESLIAHHNFAGAKPFLNKSLKAKPQMLPHVHALLGEVYADAGETQEAIAQLKMGAESDEDGGIHYQLSRLYRETGDSKSAAEALAQMKILRTQQREREATAAKDARPNTFAEDGP